MVDIFAPNRRCWEGVAGRVNQAVVFLDDICAECLHWNGGALLLYNGGARHVQQFSSFESGKPEDHKAVFIVSGPLHGTNLDILRDIVEASSFHYVIVVSTLSPAMHTVVTHGHGDDESRAFHDIEEQLLQWMGSANYTVELSYAPLVTAPITENLVVLPELEHVFSLMPADLDSLLPAISRDQKGSTNISDLNFIHLPKELQLLLKLLVCRLNSFLENLDVSEDVYSLGHTSRIVASELAQLGWAKHRRKKAKRKASLLLVDRTLDITSVVSHNWDSALDRIVSLLSKLPGHNVDVCVNMAPVCAIHSNPDHSVIVPGCLAHEDDIGSTLLRTLVDKRPKEALMDINRHLVEAATRENLPIKLTTRPGRVTAEQLGSHLSHFRGRPALLRRHKSLVQVVLAMLEALGHQGTVRLDSLLALEKGLLQGVGPDQPSAALTQLIVALKTDTGLQHRLQGLEDVFLLMIFIYSLMEDSDDVEVMTQERRLQDLLVNRILEQTDALPEFLEALVGKDPPKATVVLTIQDVFDKLRGLRRTREELQQFHSIHAPGSDTTPASLTPLLKSLVEAILDQNKPELPDVVYKSTGFRDMLKSGFGLFMNMSKPRPSDHPLLVVYVIGGVTATEVRQVREAATASHTDVQVIVASSRLSTPTDLLTQIYVRDHLHPTS